MNDIQIVDQNVAYACGGHHMDAFKGVIAKSTNGGATWDAIPHSIAQNNFTALHFFDATHGLVAASGLWLTADGGVSWLPITLPSGVNSVKNLYFVNAMNGYAVTTGTTRLIRTTNGGLSWSTVSMPTTDLGNDVNFFDANHGLVACNNGTILYTSNGGGTWTQGTNADLDLTAVLCVEMTSATVGYAGTSGGKILHTVNGGQSWTIGLDAITLSPVLMIASIYDIDFPTPQTGYASGMLAGTMIKTTNGGGIVGIEELTNEVLRIAPNPAIDYISYDAQDVRSAQLFSSEGRLIAEYSGTELNGRLYVGNLSHGAYIVKTFGLNTVSQGLFIKE